MANPNLQEYEALRVVDYLEETWGSFVESLSAHYDDPEQVAEEIIAALKGE